MLNRTETRMFTVHRRYQSTGAMPIEYRVCSRVLSAFGAKRFAITRGYHKWHVPAGGFLDLSLDNVSTANLEISSAWVDNCEVTGPDAKNVTVESTDAHSARLVAGEACDRTDLKITVPERINIRIKGQTLNVYFQKKIMGNLYISCTGGVVTMDKYRGENIFIYAPDGSVTASTALEGNIDITAASVQCQLIHSNNASIHTTNAVKLKAVYSNKLSVSSVDGPISVDMMQGNAEISSVNGSTTVSKLIGSINSTNDNANVCVYIDELTTGTTSSITSGAHAKIDVNPKVQTSLKCILQRDTQERNDSIESRLNISELVNFDSGDLSTLKEGAVEGKLCGQQSSPLYHGDKFTSGKINVKNNRKGKAYIDAQAFFKKLNGDSANEKLTASSVMSPQDLPSRAIKSKITSFLITAPFIQATSKSWMDQLKEKHGVSMA